MEKKLHCGDLFKRVLSLAMALVMLLSFAPVPHAHAADGTTVYLKPNANWLKDGARFAARFWKDADEKWVDMTDADGDGYYECIVPEGMSLVIFCRMNPDTTENNWNVGTKWNQSADLELPTDGKNCYTIAEGAWDKGSGDWSTYTPTTPEPEEPEVPDVPDEPVTEKTYIVAGDQAVCGSNWVPTDTANKMTKGENGLYTKTYSDVPAGTYRIKVTDGKDWEEGEDWGDNGQDYTFEVSAACDVTVTFNEATKAVNVTGANVAKVTKLEVKSIHAVGNGGGNWLNGKNWDASANAMEKVSDNVYQITFEEVAAGTYKFKFAANGKWDDDWGFGAEYTTFGTAADITYKGGDGTFKLDGAYDVTLQLDLTNFNYATKKGAKFTISLVAAEVEPTVDYYLVGNINGKDYTGTDYKFENGELTVTFDSTSYVAVKTSASDNWYMTNDWLGEVTSATLYDGSTLAKADKLMVPGGKALTFNLVDNKDGTLTLSYAPAEPEIPDDWTKVTIHFLKPETWDAGDMNAYVWTTGGALTGYEDYNKWPGKAVKENKDHPGWYDLVVGTEEPTAFSFIFNVGGDANKTKDLSTGEITGDTELWVVGEDVMTTAPGEWTGDYDYTANIYFQKPEAWGAGINAYIWNNGAVPGYEDYNTWPGKAIDADTVNAGWYNVSVTMDENTGFKFILNDGTNKTADLETGELQVKTDIWVVNGIAQKTAPKGWVDPNRTVHVPGTFPGPSWDAASNQMTYDPDLGLYVYTFENVPPANYEFKIAINGSWTENYGVGGEKDGSNIAVAVPETMPVTVYYNDETHLAVTNVTYKFLDIDLSGTGIPEGTKMTDEGLTGIYKATVTLPAGEYSDIKMSIKDGKTYTFNKFELKAEKAVTFFYDPASGFYYCDAIPSEIDKTKVYFDSQDVKYKAPFGSPATGEEVTFSIDTGAEVKQVSLVIKGKEPMEMTTDAVALAAADGTSIITWTRKVALDAMGEYEYYFILTDGNGIVVYGDDDGYYGKGQVTDDLTKVMPYDLVVHEAGFKTPDWMKDAVIYQIFPDRFFDGDETNNKAQTWARGTVDYEYITDWYTLPENPEQMAKLDKATYKSTGAWYGDGEWSNEIYGGDLEGITERIDYLKALGVNVIYLNPVFWSISNHRYDAVDYTKIDPILGTLGDFEELVAVAEANGMHIILDGVFNHVSDDSVYFDRYYKFLGKSEKIGAYPYWAYVYDYMAENKASQADAEDAAKTYFGENYGITDYSYTAWFEVSSTKNENGVYSYQGWWGYDSMPVIKSTNGSEYQTGNWAKEIINDPNGTDSVTEYWISKGMDGWRLDVANEVSDETWQNFRASVKALDSNAVIIGEIWDDATKYLMGDMYDSVMNYQFRSAVTNFAMGTSSVDTTKAMEKIRERYPEEAFYAMMNLVGSHDTTRILSYLDGIGDDRADKSMAAAFPTYATTSQTAKDRQYLVSFLQFTYAGAPTIYYGDEIGMVGADDPDDRRAFTWGKGNKELVEWYAGLAAIRSAYSALRTGSVEAFSTGNDDVMGFVRGDDNNTLVIMANRASAAKTISYEGTWVDLISGETFTDSVTVPAYRGVILVAKEEVKNVTVNTADLAPAYDPAYIVAERSETPHSHTYDQMVVADKYLASEADCVNAATYYYSCACGEADPEEKTFSSGNPLDHDWDDGKITTPATCVEEGVKTFTCKRDANHTKTEDVEIDPDNHDLFEGETTEGTCVTEGTITYHCEREGCDYEKTEKTGLNEDNHEGETVIKNKSETYSGDIHCGSCDELLEEGKVIAVPSTPIKPAKPNWKNLLDKIFGNWWGDKDEKPQEPTEPEKPSEPENEPSEPEKPTEPEQTVPSKPITPAKPIWSNIIKKIFGWWKK